jgi:nucleotide-binding universal stress UspA family protein
VSGSRVHVPAGAVVVGIGDDARDAAIGYAIDEARRLARPVHLVHVLQVAASEVYIGVHRALQDSGRALLARAEAAARDLSGSDVAVTTELVDDGWVVDDLVRCSREASLVVVEHRDLSRLRRVLTGSFAHGVAARASSPVVSVPASWDPTRLPTWRVVVAVQDSSEAPDLLRAGFDEARARGATLTVLHAWWLASGYDLLVVDQDVRDHWKERSREELEPVLAPLREEYAEVHVRVRVRHAPPVDAVLDVSPVADLIVLGRRHHRLPLGTHLGPVARAALGHAACPVMITPEPSPTAPPRVPATDGERAAPAG